MIRIKWAQAIVKRRLILLAASLLCTVFCAAMIGKTNINFDLTKYLSDDTMTKKALIIMEKEFGSGEQLRVMFSDQPESSLKEYIAAMNALPAVLAASHDPDSGILRAEGKTWQLVTVAMNGGSAAAMVEQLRGMFPEAGRYYVGGSAADQLDVQRSVGKEIPEVMIIAVLVVLIMLLATSHAWLEPVPILFALSVSIVMNMGTNFIFRDVSFITFAVSAILQLALSIDYAIMLLHTFNGYMDNGLDAEKAMTESLSECFMRIASSAMTTVAGLMSLVFMSFTIGFDIGLVLSKGILFSMLSVFLFMPAVILLMKRPLRRSRHKPLNFGGESLARVMSGVRKPLAAGMILLVLGGLFLSTRNVYSFTGAALKTKGESAAIADRFGSSNPVVFLLPGGEEDRDYDRQRALVGKLLALRTEDGVPVVTSVSSMVTTGEMALRYYTAEEVSEMTGLNPTAVGLFFRMHGFGASVRADRLLEAVSPLAAGIGRIAGLQAQLQAARKAFIGPTRARMLAEVGFDMSDTHAGEYMAQILSAAAEVYGNDYFVTGGPMSTYDISNAFRGDLVKVNIITLLAILLIVTISFRSLGLPLLLVFVIEGAIWITMGFSRLTGQSVFFISYLICLSIQMGATIDYAILLSDQYRSLRRREMPPADALAEAMKKSLSTILTSGIIITVAGFIIGKRCSIFYISDIGLLVSRGALVSVILILTLLPALLFILDGNIIRKKRNCNHP